MVLFNLAVRVFAFCLGILVFLHDQFASNYENRCTIKLAGIYAILLY